MKDKFFREVVKSVQEAFPLRYSVRVRRSLVPKDRSGDCWLDYPKRQFIIRVDKKLAQTWAVHIFLHEYAHAMSWKRRYDCHDEDWGRAYSELYHHWLEFLGLDTKKKVAKLH